jgi:3',5'-cyclic AMP phosphodiesterase CpdA
MAFFLPYLLSAAEELPYLNGPYSPFPVLEQTAKKIPKDGPVKFIVMGDSRHGKAFLKILELAKSLKPDLIIHTGDMVNRGSGDISDWFELEKEISSFSRTIPFLPALGNHELMIAPASTGKQRFLKFFALENPYYTFDFANCRFIVLGWEFEKDKAQMLWLQKIIRERGDKHLFIVTHLPFYTVGEKSAQEVPNTPTKTTAMFKSFGAEVVFSGHEHMYYRTRREGVTYVISGAAGAEPYATERKSDAVDGDCWLAVSPDTGKYVRKDPVTGRETPADTPFCFVEVTVQGDNITCRTIDVNGKEVDTFVPVLHMQEVIDSQPK